MDFISTTTALKLILTSLPIVLIFKKLKFENFLIDFTVGLLSIIGYQELIGLKTPLIGITKTISEISPGISGFVLNNQFLAVVIYSLFITHMNYWVHRIFHENNFLWRLHVFHHSQNQFTGLSQFRSHPLEEIIATYGTALITALIVPETIIYAKYYGYFAFIMGILNHSNIVHKPSFLDKIFITPMVHRVHHSLEERHFDRNFGFVFSIWDQIYGTFYNPANEKRRNFKIGLSEFNGKTNIRILFESLLPYRRSD